MKKVLLILLLLAACTTSPMQTQERWQDPRTISLVDDNGAFEIIFYPNNNTQNLIITNGISDEVRDLNVIVKQDVTESQLRSIEAFALRNNLELQR